MCADILLDRSSSMANKSTEAHSVINGYVAQLAHTMPALAVTLTAFDDPGPEAFEPYKVLTEVPWFEVIPHCHPR